MPMISTSILAGKAVGNINLNGHQLYMGGGNIYLQYGALAFDGASYIASVDNDGSLQLIGSNLDIYLGAADGNFTMEAYATLNGILSMNTADPIINVSEIDWTDGSVQTSGR
ncbi:MAG: hypothetical protein ABSG31_07845 [Tepidisphaeraceae bacterium]